MTEEAPPPESSWRGHTSAYAALTFLSALLLFLVQPLLARAILPWFGGAASVWTTCLLFYQALLFLGYVYGHLGRRLGPRRQAALHIALLGLTLLMLPVTVSPAWRPQGPEHPVLHLLALLTVTVGGPYLLLAGTTPFLHDSFAREPFGRAPYRLYAVSNAGSLLALLAYPAVLEPLLSVHAQAVAWSWGYAAFAVGMAALVWSRRGRRAEEAAPPVPFGAGAPAGVPSPRPTAGDGILWVALAACGSGLLMALTNAITMDVASVPLLWIIPLAVYLTTIILAFAGVYRRETWGALLVLALGAASLLWAGGFALPVLPQVVLASGVLFTACMVCHGELARSAPHPDHLTAFYLAMAGGGALGGLVVAGVAPAVLTDFYELPAFMLLAYGLLLASMLRDPASVLRGRWRRPAIVLLTGVLVVATGGFVLETRTRTRGTLASVRNFYGVLRVQDHPPGVLHDMRVLRHGQIFHGAEFLDPARRDAPTLYFTEGSGLARAVAARRRTAVDGTLRIGVVGLGIGTVTAWSRPGDRVRFYEINPAAVTLARTYFSFLADAPAPVDVVLGDGRLALAGDVAAAAGRPLFDLLVVDAFAGDAVPVHLLTREAMRLYRSAVGPGGVVVFQITNRHVALGRVVRGLARAEGLQAVRVDQDPPPSSGGVANSWMLVAAPGTPLPASRVRDPRAEARPPVLWTDDYSNLLGVLR